MTSPALMQMQLEDEEEAMRLMREARTKSKLVTNTAPQFRREKLNTVHDAKALHHKLESALHELDPIQARWEQRQRAEEHKAADLRHMIQDRRLQNTQVARKMREEAEHKMAQAHAEMEREESRRAHAEAEQAMSMLQGAMTTNELRPITAEAAIRTSNKKQIDYDVHHDRRVAAAAALADVNMQAAMNQRAGGTSHKASEQKQRRLQRSEIDASMRHAEAAGHKANVEGLVQDRFSNALVERMETLETRKKHSSTTQGRVARLHQEEDERMHRDPSTALQQGMTGRREAGKGVARDNIGLRRNVEARDVEMGAGRAKSGPVTSRENVALQHQPTTDLTQTTTNARSARPAYGRGPGTALQYLDHNSSEYEVQLRAGTDHGPDRSANRAYHEQVHVGPDVEHTAIETMDHETQQQHTGYKDKLHMHFDDEGALNDGFAVQDKHHRPGRTTTSTQGAMLQADHTKQEAGELDTTDRRLRRQGARGPLAQGVGIGSIEGQDRSLGPSTGSRHFSSKVRDSSSSQFHQNRTVEPVGNITLAERAHASKLAPGPSLAPVTQTVPQHSAQAAGFAPHSRTTRPMKNMNIGESTHLGRDTDAGTYAHMSALRSADTGRGIAHHAQQHGATSRGVWGMEQTVARDKVQGAQDALDRSSFVHTAGHTVLARTGQRVQTVRPEERADMPTKEDIVHAIERAQVIKGKNAEDCPQAVGVARAMPTNVLVAAGQFQKNQPDIKDAVAQIKRQIMCS